MKHSSSPHHHFKYRFGILLAVFLLQLLTAPLFEGTMAEGYIDDTLFYLFLAAAAYSVMNSRFFKLCLFWGLGAIALEFTGYFISPTPVMMVISNSVSGAYLAFVTVLIAASIFRQPKISTDNVMGGLCVYVMVGAFWTVLYVNLVLLNPDAFSYGIHGAHLDVGQRYGLLYYYSFVTLLTIGFGDVVPLSSMAQTLTVLEGLIGQFYLVFFMASLVGLYVSRRRSP